MVLHQELVQVSSYTSACAFNLSLKVACLQWWGQRRMAQRERESLKTQRRIIRETEKLKNPKIIQPSHIILQLTLNYTKLEE